MKTAIELGKNAAEFHGTTGVNYVTFTIILEKVVSYVVQFKEQNPISKRGRKGSTGSAKFSASSKILTEENIKTMASTGTW